jgi:hypothetical protein
MKGEINFQEEGGVDIDDGENEYQDYSKGMMLSLNSSNHKKYVRSITNQN